MTVCVTTATVVSPVYSNGSFSGLVQAVRGVEGLVDVSMGTVAVVGAALVFMAVSVFVGTVVVAAGVAVSNLVEVMVGVAVGSRVVDLASAELLGSKPSGAGVAVMMVMMSVMMAALSTEFMIIPEDISSERVPVGASESAAGISRVDLLGKIVVESVMTGDRRQVTVALALVRVSILVVVWSIEVMHPTLPRRKSSSESILPRPFWIRIWLHVGESCPAHCLDLISRCQCISVTHLPGCDYIAIRCVLRHYELPELLALAHNRIKSPRY